MLPLTFADPANYDHIGEDDRIAVLGPASLESGKTVTFEVTSPSGEVWSFQANHTFSEQQIEWFKAGSALNVIRRNLEK